MRQYVWDFFKFHGIQKEEVRQSGKHKPIMNLLGQYATLEDDE